jgi:hypothetical protein
MKRNLKLTLKNKFRLDGTNTDWLLRRLFNNASSNIEVIYGRNKLYDPK